MSLRGKIALITGATSGIGEATARHFVQEGAKVVATGRNAEKLDRLKAEIGCEVIVGDVTAAGECQRIVTEAAGKYAGMTTLINVAGILKGGAFGSPACTVDNFMDNFNANTKSVFEMMTHAVPHLKETKQKGGAPAIVNVGSVNGVHPFQGTASYCTSKAATEMLTKCAALDLAEFGIRVNAVNPGLVVTELQKRGGMSEEAYEGFHKRSIDVTHPLGKALDRVATVDECAYLIAFLASDKAGFITAESVRIDGGRGALGAR
ncbi:3-oxoacyl-[acyl-carrier-protein] reductase FabG [Diplonema papillatum]|nr:3-oxoacyl-[acyl-carrier-protein] reductase FabG [Diplonema papillatum]|eukprot:gene13514-20810_t